MICRHCASPLKLSFVDLGFAPPSNAYLAADDLNHPEMYFPLRVNVCETCWLVQTQDFAEAEKLFSADYAYFSSTSTSWLEHAAKYARKMIHEMNLGASSLVIEVASNDGYLLKNFVAKNIPCIGIEPTDSTADAAEKLGIPVLRSFFNEALGKKLQEEGKQADLIAGNNVYAHVPDINDFTRGLKAALKPEGVITLEFPHLMRLIEHTQFDTIYHEHFSYLSLFTANRIFESCGLRIWHVDELPTHGGSLRIYGCHKAASHQTQPVVQTILEEEKRRGMQAPEIYADFQKKADLVKDEFLAFLIKSKQAGKKVAAYGAAAKGNTLLNYAGIKPDLLPFVCDAAASKQGQFLPGSHIPILPPHILQKERPDFLVILPWNLASEIMHQNAGLSAAGTKFVTTIPRLEIR